MFWVEKRYLDSVFPSLNVVFFIISHFRAKIIKQSIVYNIKFMFSDLLTTFLMNYFESNICQSKDFHFYDKKKKKKKVNEENFPQIPLTKHILGHILVTYVINLK